jgi:type I restriction enzyme M protein
MPIRHLSDDALADPRLEECISRGFIEIADERVTYNLGQKKTYSWKDPEEWVRCRCIAFLIIEKQYPQTDFGQK